MKEFIYSLIILILGFLLIMVNPGFACSYVLYDPLTEQIIDISPVDDAVVEEGQEKVCLELDVPILQPLEFYRISGNQVIFDAQKFNNNEIEKAKLDAERAEKKKEERLIEQKIKEIAFDALEEEGVIFQKIKKEDFKKIKKEK